MITGSGQRQPITHRCRSCSWDVFPYDLLPNQLRPVDLLLGQVSKGDREAVEGAQKKGLLHEVCDFVQQPLCICPYGAIGASRTRDPLLRRQMLYPSELQPQELLEFTKNTRKVQAVPRLHP